MPPSQKVTPRTFYLNEQHELLRGEKEGGGAIAQYHGINWASKGKAVADALVAVRASISQSKDPLRDQHYFVLAKPVEAIQKKSKSRKAVDGIITEHVRFNESDSRIFRRLGIDLIDTTSDGAAVVHVRPERVEQLVATGNRLGEANQREQARWASLDTFDVIPVGLRLDSGWVRSLRPHVPSDAVVEFQPLLGRVEVDTLIRSIAAILQRDLKEALTNIGMDFSGRHWARGKITPETLRAIARLYYSVQTLHSPLTSIVWSSKKSAGPKRDLPSPAAVASQDPTLLPTVAILDTGVPADHSALGPYKRGQYVAPDSCGQHAGDHGSFVASRVVFGDPDFGDGPPTTQTASCRFYDVLVATSPADIDNKSVVAAIQAIVATAPDVRVFNLSFDTAPVEQQELTKRRENLFLVQDLDNLIFRDDIFVVVSAGNSPAGVQPTVPYPQHFSDPNWQLGAWARSFNAVTCGSYVARLYPGGLVTSVGWPSPFTRVGPGTSDSPKPDFSAHGGNGNASMKHAIGLGVWGLTAASNWEDKSGTSFAAPLVAREAASAFHQPQKVCTAGARPYSVTVRAFLGLTAVRPTVDGVAAELAKRSLGRGTVSHERLKAAKPHSAVLLWQGLLEGPDDIARVTLPIPKVWLEGTTAPRLRLVACWDPPVNAAVSGLWATRRVTVHLKANPDGKSLHGSRGGHASYPLIDRTYDLQKLPKDETVQGDVWLLELSYEQIGDYHAGITFTPQQRVAFAAEIFDAGENATSPQMAIQAMGAAVTMSRLSVPPQAIATPVVIKPLS